MQITSATASDGVREETFQLGEIPGVLWTPDGITGTRPLIVLGHGGGQHKKAPGMAGRARRLVTQCGFAVVSVDVPNHGDRPMDERYARIATDNQARVADGADFAALLGGFHALVAEQTVPEWRSVIDAVQELEHVGPGPAGYWGVSMGCGLGVPFVAAEPRVRAAVLGLGGGAGPLLEAAARITVPVEFAIQWDDERIPRADGLALFEAFGSVEKTLHANPGKHGDMPRFEVDSGVRFLARHLTPATEIDR